jgi:hypothetical protein
MANTKNDPYLTGASSGPWDRPHRAPHGHLVAVLDERGDGVGLKLIANKSRAAELNEINELAVTDEDAAPGTVVERAAFIAFVEFTIGGMLIVGDRVEVNGETIGEIAGFDEAAMPNHQTIVLRAAERTTGRQRGYRLGDAVTFVPVFSPV